MLLSRNSGLTQSGCKFEGSFLRVLHFISVLRPHVPQGREASRLGFMSGAVSVLHTHHSFREPVLKLQVLHDRTCPEVLDDAGVREGAGYKAVIGLK